MKYGLVVVLTEQRGVAPVRERGLKLIFYLIVIFLESRSRKGAWIEMHRKPYRWPQQHVAPVRERGLKSVSRCTDSLKSFGRSRKGAWIEIPMRIPKMYSWRHVAPVRERGLKWQPQRRQER